MINLNAVMKAIRLIVVIVLAWMAAPTSAQSLQRFVSPGLKLGYHSSNGFIIGAEVSYVAWPRAGAHAGLCFNLDWVTSGITKLHLGVEAGYAMLGAQYGPTLIFERGRPAALGSTFTAYGLAIVMPYVAHTWNMPTLHGTELGVLGKIPLDARTGEVPGPPH